MPPLILVLAQLVVVLATARLVGRAVRVVGQPQVVGEMIAGVILGPSVLGGLAPRAWATLFPPASLGFLGLLSQLGLILFMFLVGLELDTASLRRQGTAALAISWSSIVAPFALGAALALWLHPSLAPAGIGELGFALFLGAAMSVTAFPVLARILESRALTRTPIGSLAIGCAAVDDVSAWLILAVVVSVVRAGDTASLFVTLGGTVAYVALMLTVGARILGRFGRRVAANGTIEPAELAAVLVLMFVSAGITELLGIHALFGAFLTGAAMPRDDRFRDAVALRFQDLLEALLLPLFFAYTGLRTSLEGVAVDGTLFVALGAILLVAVAGKFGGTILAARVTGMSWRAGALLGALLNTRGLMELVILNIGLDIGVISPTLFTLMVIMAVFTTIMTTPAVSWLARGLDEARPAAPRPPRAGAAEGATAARGEPDIAGRR
ncbi:MAG TPA: cation:proton antiporter [Gemmatimonadaceae bacterium]|nr:cation:proton antiporter [Gemmatimonadaceae bacterium]